MYGGKIFGENERRYKEKGLEMEGAGRNESWRRTNRGGERRMERRMRNKMSEVTALQL